MQGIGIIRQKAREAIQGAKDVAELEAVRNLYLGRGDGEVTKLLRSLKDHSAEDKRVLGPQIQLLKTEVEDQLNQKLAEFKKVNSRRGVDMSRPAPRVTRGHLHPLTIASQEIRRIFMGMNFSIVEGPEVESEYYNFDALNFPEHHPARETQDTFWLKPTGPKMPTEARQRMLLRTQTSNVQVRHAEANQPPFQILCPGRVYRNEAVDAGHEVNFYQAEGMAVGKNITLANFKFVVEEFLRKFYGDGNIEFRYRPSYFPFTEPSVEIDIKLKGKWFEVMGAGMVNPHVFEYAHLNPREWQGFAFGMGLDRLTMIKFGITDVRLFYSGDLRLVHQF